MGKSLYKFTSGPTSIEFVGIDIDTYSFTVILEYNLIVEQTIQIAIFSANNPPESLMFNVKGRYVRLEFTFTVTEEPKYPSGQEVAEQVVQQIANHLSEFRTQTEWTIKILTQNIQTQWILLGLIGAISVAYLLSLLFYVMPMVRRGGSAVKPILAIESKKKKEPSKIKAEKVEPKEIKEEKKPD